MLREGFQAFGEAIEGKDGFFLRSAVAENSRTLQRFFAPHDEEIWTVAFLCEMELFCERFYADILRQRDARFTKVFGEADGEPFRFVADVDEGEAQSRRFGPCDYRALASHLKDRACRTEWGSGEEMPHKVVIS